MAVDLKDKTFEELENIVIELGQKKFLASYIFRFIHAQNIPDISHITPLSKVFRQELAEKGYFISGIASRDKKVDEDGTAKYLFALGDKQRIETVLLRDGRRKTLCASTQAGCDMGCAFCATGRIKCTRNLTAGEIAAQVNQVEADSGKITNLVFMGMGEPLLNYSAVMKAIEILNHPRGKNIGIRHITVSTCGIIPMIEKLASEKLQPRLAISLNAPENALRTKIMPVNKNFPLDELMKAVKYYQDKTRQRVTFEYVMIKNLNDSRRHAEIFVNLVRDVPCNVNLIAYNPHPGCKFRGSDSGTIKEFASVLNKAHIETVTRFRMGREINAACGQLGADWLKNERVRK